MDIDRNHTTETLVEAGFDKNSMFLKLSLQTNNDAIQLNNTKILVGGESYDLKAHQGDYKVSEFFFTIFLDDLDPAFWFENKDRCTATNFSFADWGCVDACYCYREVFAFYMPSDQNFSDGTNIFLAKIVEKSYLSSFP